MQRLQSRSPTSPSSPETETRTSTFQPLSDDKKHQRNLSSGSNSISGGAASGVVQGSFSSFGHPSGSIGHSASSGSSSGPTQVSRLDRSRFSMIENLPIGAPPINYGPPPPKSATLPTSFPTYSTESSFVSFLFFVPAPCLVCCRSLLNGGPLAPSWILLVTPKIPSNPLKTRPVHSIYLTTMYTCILHVKERVCKYSHVN